MAKRPVLSSRRKFFKHVSTTTTAVIAALVAWRVGWKIRHKIAMNQLNTEKTGKITTDVAAKLVAAAEIVIGRTVDKFHYQNFFHWKAGNRAGYKKIYEDFADELTSAALAIGNVPLKAQTPSVRE